MTDEANPVVADSHEMVMQTHFLSQCDRLFIDVFADDSRPDHRGDPLQDGQGRTVGLLQRFGDGTECEHPCPVGGIAVDHAGIVDINDLTRTNGLPACPVGVVGRGQAAAAHWTVEVRGDSAACAGGQVAEEEILIKGPHLAATGITAPPHPCLEQTGQLDLGHPLTNHGRHLGKDLIKDRTGSLEQTDFVV